MKKLFNFFFETIIMAALALAIVFPIRYFLFQPFIVSGNSMSPNFQDGDYLIVDEISYRFQEPARGEVVVFKAPNQSSAPYIKRIIGLPGETMEILGGRITISDQNGTIELLDESGYLSNGWESIGFFKVSLEEDEYFVLGDNRQFSSDSRSWGSLSRDRIVGRAIFRAWPIRNLAFIERPLYSPLIPN